MAPGACASLATTVGCRCAVHLMSFCAVRADTLPAMNNTMLSIALATALAGSALCATDAQRVARFAALHAERGFVTGQVGPYQVEMFVGVDRVTGVSPAGRVNVLVTGAVVTGTVGNARVFLIGPGQVLAGTGPRGAVRLSCAGNAISGYCGPLVVNMMWTPGKSHDHGGWLQGTIGTAAVSLYTGPLANTVVAALLAALM